MEAVIFDFDGVLADTFDLNLEVCKIFDSGLSAEDFKKQHRSGWKEEPKINTEGVDIDDLIEEQRKRLGCEHLFPLREVIEEVAENHELFIVSSSSERNIEEILLEENLNRYFDKILGPKTSTSKTEKIEILMDEYSLDPEGCVLITDTLGDIKEAEEVGIKTIGVTWGFHESGTLAEGDPDALVQDFEDLPEAIERV